MISVIHWQKSRMQFKFSQLFLPDPLDQMKNGRYDPLEHRNSSPYLSKQNSKSDQKMESSLTDFIGEEYARNVFYDCCSKRYEQLTLFYLRPVRSGFMFGGGNTSGCLVNVDIDHECLSNV